MGISVPALPPVDMDRKRREGVGQGSVIARAGTVLVKDLSRLRSRNGEFRGDRFGGRIDRQEVGEAVMLFQQACDGRGAVRIRLR